MTELFEKSYNYGPMKFDVFSHWTKDLKDISDKDSPDYYILRWKGEEFGRVFRKSGGIKKNGPPSYDTVVSWAQKEIITETEKVAKNILSVIESREDRFNHVDVQGSVNDFSEGECLALIDVLHKRIQEIDFAERLVGKLYKDLTCYKCGVKFQIRADAAFCPETCIPCYEKQSGNKSGCTDYKEFGGRK